MDAVLRRLLEHMPLALLGLLAAIVAIAVISDWRILWESGGWYAVLGQSLAVITTLTILLLLGALALAILLLPVFVYFALADPDSIENLTPASAVSLLYCRTTRLFARCLSVLYVGANFVWKVVWWGWWFIADKK